MTLRIRFPQGRLVKRRREKSRELAMATASLITPLCVMAYVLAFWRLATDVGVAGDSGLQGIFSHWQLWFALAVALQLTSRNLDRNVPNGESLRDEVADRIK